MKGGKTVIRVTIIADRVEELRQFLQRTAEQSKPNTFKSLKDIDWAVGSYVPKHAKKDRSR